MLLIFFGNFDSPPGQPREEGAGHRAATRGPPHRRIHTQSLQGLVTMFLLCMMWCGVARFMA